MTDFFMSNKQYIFLLIAVTAFTVFGIYKAVTSSITHNRLYRQEEEKIKKLKYLKDKFSVLDEASIDSAEDSELLPGVALYYQLMLQKKDDMEEAFLQLPLPARYIYTLDIFLSEGGKPSEFFKNNGKPLTDLLVPALCAIGCENEGAIILPVKEMYDEDAEDVSLDRNTVEIADAEFEKSREMSGFYIKAAEYIRNSKKYLISSEQ